MAPFSSVRSTINALVDQNGPHFLLSANGHKVVCNSYSYDIPSVAALFSELPNKALLGAFANKSDAQKALHKLARTTHLVSGQITGLRIVKSAPVTHIPHSGGSYSRTYAHLEHGRWRIVKECATHRHDDKDLRLISELESIALLPQKAQSLYPKVLASQKTKSQVRFQLEYIPYDTFASLILSSNYASEQLSGLLAHIYDTLFDRLYTLCTDQPPYIKADFYNTTINRRLKDIADELDATHYLHNFLAAPQININDNVYAGLQKTLDMAQLYLSDKIIPNTHNHGDMIFQDILIDPTSGDFRLIDGNGRSTSYIYDFAKTLLCLQTKYDVLYEGDFILETAFGSVPTATLQLTSDVPLETLEAMCGHFWQYLSSHEEAFFKNMRDWRKTLLVICGLQNIAIVMFHILHHKEHKRACAFLLSGIQLIQDTLKNAEMPA